MTGYPKELTETIGLSDVRIRGVASIEDGTWSEFCKVGICAQSGTEIEYQAITETVDIDVGDKDFDVIATLSGGRVVKFSPQEPITVTFEAYATEAGTDTGTTGKGFFDLMNTKDSSQPIQISADRIRTPYRLVLLWTNDSSNAGPSNTILTDMKALRIVASEGKFTSVKQSFTDGLVKFTVTYKVEPFDSSGNANFKIESTDDGDVLAALADYTSSTKW